MTTALERLERLDTDLAWLADEEPIDLGPGDSDLIAMLRDTLAVAIEDERVETTPQAKEATP